MSDLVGNSEDRFSRVAAQVSMVMSFKCSDHPKIVFDHLRII